MRTWIRSAQAACAVLLVLLLAAPAPLRADAYDGHPKLIVVIVIDQFRGDLLERYRADFHGNGFRLFLDRGAVFPDCYYDYANTRTAPGHATIATGAYTDGHGIPDNQWWDLKRNTRRPVTAVEDDRYTEVGGPHPGSPSASPRNLLASTLGDELRLATQGQSKVYAVSMKDRAAILSAGAAANGAFWMDEKSGKFITSSFYMTALPDWAQQFNAGDATAVAMQQSGIATVTDFYEQVGATPAGNDYELNFAQALIAGEDLGKHATPDLLIISLSPNDLIGHRFGPDSPEAKASALGLDASLDAFFSSLDKTIDGGLGNVWIALSADHGVAPTPAVASSYGLPGANISMSALATALNAAINAKFSPGEKQSYVLPRQDLPYIALDERSFARAGINEQEAEDAALAALPDALASLTNAGPAPAKPAAAPPPADNATPAAPAAAQTAPAAPTTSDAGKSDAQAPAAAAATPSSSAEPQASAADQPAAAADQPSAPAPPHRWPAPPAIAHAYTRLAVARGEYPASEFGRLLAHSYASVGGWWIMLEPEAFQMAGSDPTHTDHYSVYSYDRHVPLAFFGAPFGHGIFRGRVQPVDMAATLASLLNINQPSASVGQILTQALRTPAYPTTAKPAPHRRIRTAATSADADNPTSETPQK